jgi:uncharacterized protein (TIGR00730 family)
VNICIFGGASPSIHSEYTELAHATGAAIAAAGHSLVFGGGARGVMGAAASGAVAAGGRVVGILPQFLCDREPPHAGIADLRIVQTMHERKAQMYELSDAFIALPGGFGTLDESMEIMTWRQLSLHTKPVVFLGSHGFWSGIEATFDLMRRTGFLSERDRHLASFAATPAEAIQTILSWTQAA